MSYVFPIPIQIALQFSNFTVTILGESFFADILTLDYFITLFGRVVIFFRGVNTS